MVALRTVYYFYLLQFIFVFSHIYCIYMYCCSWYGEINASHDRSVADNTDRTCQLYLVLHINDRAWCARRAGRRINAVRDVICDGCGLPVVAAAAQVATAAGDDECSRQRSTLHKIACVRQPVEPADLFLPPILASEPDTVVGADRCCLSARRCELLL